MSLFETTAYAAPAGGAGGDAGLINLLFLGGFVLIFYFLLIRPQNKRRKEHQALVGGLSKGDEIVTAGGVVGLVNKVEDDFVKVQVSRQCGDAHSEICGRCHLAQRHDQIPG